MIAACVAHAAASYGVTRPAIEATLKRPASAGGIGPMHIPTSWLPILSRIGFSPVRIVHDRCTNIEAGAWVLAFDQWHKRMKAPAPAGISRPVLPASRHSLAQRAAVKPACITQAAQFYHLPVSLFSAVLRTEGGRVGEVHRNKNGSVDLGPAQINSTWLPALAKAGITRRMVRKDGCLNVAIGAWILAQAMRGADPHNPVQWWRHVGDYNSHTPLFNQKYAAMVWHNIKR